MDFFTFIGNKEMILVTTFISMYLTVFAVYITWSLSKSRNRKSNIEKSYQLLLKGIEQKTLDAKSVFLIYNNQVANKYNGISFLQYLESFIIFVREQDENGNTTMVVTSLITPIMEKEREEKPYSYLDEKDRHLLLAIENCVKSNENHSLNNHLTDLSFLLENNKKSLRRSQVINAWTIPISFIGILLTLFIWLYGSRLSDADIHRISQEISVTITNGNQENSSEEKPAIGK